MSWLPAFQRKIQTHQKSMTTFFQDSENIYCQFKDIVCLWEVTQGQTITKKTMAKWFNQSLNIVSLVEIVWEKPNNVQRHNQTFFIILSLFIASQSHINFCPTVAVSACPTKKVFIF